MAFISKKIEELINLRIVEEEKSSRLYFAMSKWLAYNGYSGASKLWAKYSNEEITHSGWAYSYLEDLDLLPHIPALESPICEFKSLPEICQLSYDHEILISNQCNDLAKAALQENDFMTLELAQRYLKEQSEEISRQTFWLDRLTAFGESKEALRLLDNEMGS
jgi:ferritin